MPHSDAAAPWAEAGGCRGLPGCLLTQGACQKGRSQEGRAGLAHPAAAPAVLAYAGQRSTLGLAFPQLHQSHSQGVPRPHHVPGAAPWDVGSTEKSGSLAPATPCPGHTEPSPQGLHATSTSVPGRCQLCGGACSSLPAVVPGVEGTWSTAGGNKHIEQQRGTTGSSRQGSSHLAFTQQQLGAEPVARKSLPCACSPTAPSLCSRNFVRRVAKLVHYLPC